MKLGAGTPAGPLERGCADLPSCVPTLGMWINWDRYGDSFFFLFFLLLAALLCLDLVP